MNEDNIKAFVPVCCPKCQHVSLVEILVAANLLGEEEAQKILKEMGEVEK